MTAAEKLRIRAWLDEMNENARAEAADEAPEEDVPTTPVYPGTPDLNGEALRERMESVLNAVSAMATALRDTARGDRSKGYASGMRAAVRVIRDTMLP